MFKKPFFIGLSLSFCVRDIAEGKVPYEKVRFISAGTKISNAISLERVIIFYEEHYWQGLPNARQICVRLWSENKIKQPRLEGKRPKISKHGKTWINCA